MSQLPLVAEPSDAQLTAAAIATRAMTLTASPMVGRSFRLPVQDLAKLEAMSIHSGKSVNSVLVMVVTAGLEAIDQHLPDEVKQQLRALAADTLGQEGEA